MKIVIDENRSIGINFLIGLLRYLEKCGFENVLLNSLEQDNDDNWVIEIYPE